MAVGSNKVMEDLQHWHAALQSVQRQVIHRAHHRGHADKANLSNQWGLWQLTLPCVLLSPINILITHTKAAKIATLLFCYWFMFWTYRCSCLFLSGNDVCCGIIQGALGVIERMRWAVNSCLGVLHIPITRWMGNVWSRLFRQEPNAEVSSAMIS